MNWILYIVEANLYLVSFYLLYRVLLSKETFYTLNRYYLLAGTLTAFLLPLVQAGFLFDLLPAFRQQAQAPSLLAAAESQVSANYLSINFLVPAIYSAIACLLLIRTLYDLCRLLVLAYKAKSNTYKQVNYFELKGTEVAFSFLDMLFINPAAADKDIIIRHEQVHMRQYHSFDTLLLEIVHAFSWFNPILFLLKKDLNTLHEFIADDQTSSGELVEKHAYAMLLIQNSFGLPVNALVKPIYNQSSLKKRIVMLNQPKSASRARLRMLFALPLICAMICSSTLAFSKSYKLIDLYASGQRGIQTLVQDTSKRLPPPPPPAAPKHLRTTSKRKAPPQPPLAAPKPVAAPKPPSSLRDRDVPPPPKAPVAPAANIAVQASPSPVVAPVPAVAPRPSVHRAPPPPPVDPERKN
jgi:beta-lactamase regulating signal transducer with metallopeptidase domain